MEEQLLNSIRDDTKADLHCQPIVLKLKDVSLLLVVVHLWPGEGLTDRNQFILHQIKSVIHLVNLPFLVVGDFNNTPQQLEDEGWPRQLRAQIC